MDQHVPIIRNQSSGIFSLCKIRENTIIVVGGDYTQPEKTSQNCAISLTNEQLWKPITAALKAIRYKGDVVIESFTTDVKVIARAAAIWRKMEPTREEIATKGLKFLKKAFK